MGRGADGDRRSGMGFFVGAVIVVGVVGFILGMLWPDVLVWPVGLLVLVAGLIWLELRRGS